MTCTKDDLRTLFLFEKLTDEQLDWLCRKGDIEVVEPGWVYREGDPATCFYVLVQGGLIMTRRVGDDDIEVNRTHQPGVYGGAESAGTRRTERSNERSRSPWARIAKLGLSSIL